MSDLWRRVQSLQGKTLHTLTQKRPFQVVDVQDDQVVVLPISGKKKPWPPIRRDRIEYIASLKLPREQIRKRVREEFSDSVNPSYIAAIVNAVTQ